MARKNPNLNWNGGKIILTQDYSKPTVDTRKGFLALREKLRSNNIAFSFVGPAKFRITDRGRTQVFEDPRSLRDYLMEPLAQPMKTTTPVSGKRGPSPEHKERLRRPTEEHYTGGTDQGARREV